MRRSAVATLFVGAALLLSACSTTTARTLTPTATTAASEQVEKPVTYEQLHGMMVKLVQESAIGAATASTVDSGASGALASNP
jgi:hypothetical protein